MSNQSRCIIDDFGGKNHPYGYCIKPIEEMIDYEYIRKKSRAFNMTGITEAISAIVNYTTALVTNPSKAIASECRNQLGNKYVLKSKSKCKNMNENVHYYINNIVDYNPLTKRYEPSPGIVPAAIRSALAINGIPLIKALYEDPEQNCIKVDLQCHIVYENDSVNNYTGPVNDVPITVSQYDELIANKRIKPTPAQKTFREELEKNENSENYTNLHESIHNYLDNNPNLLPSKNLEIEEDNSYDEDLLFNLYYLFLSAFLLFLIFKIIDKK